MIIKAVLNWIWSPLLVAGVAIAGYFMEWPIEIIVPVMLVIIITGLIGVVVGAREKETERLSERLRHLMSYFNRRFMGDSSLSIFAIIESLFKTENTKLWEWARSCDMAQRVFNTWSQSTGERLEVDTKTARFGVYIRTYLNELWIINSLYYEFVEQFQEIAESVDIPPETTEQYNKFVNEYNAFTENLRTFISDCLEMGKTEIEAPSVKDAAPVTQMARFEAKKKEEPEQGQPPIKRDNKGYYAGF